MREITVGALAATSHREDGARASLTGSFGIASHRDGRTLESTIAAADHPLYGAKEEGRNRVIAERESLCVLCGE